LNKDIAKTLISFETRTLLNNHSRVSFNSEDGSPKANPYNISKVNRGEPTESKKEKRIKRERAVKYWKERVIQDFLPPIDQRMRNEINSRVIIDKFIEHSRKRSKDLTEF
jgi:hypothetical protein